MGQEIERKYLVSPERWSPGSAHGVPFRQGYLSIDPARIVRVRSTGEAGFLTIKGHTSGIVRDEYEYSIPLGDAERMLDHLCIRPLIEKRRYKILVMGHEWDVDVFEGENAGLIIAEIELSRADQVVPAPDWAGPDVSADSRYANASLVANPFGRWLRNA